MSNTNCLENIECPNCGNDSRIFIETKTMAEVTDEGAETFGDMEWDGDSFAECPECGRQGTLSDFQVAMETKPDQTVKE